MPSTTVPEQNFQPQVPDTSHGPHLHTYTPRDDGSILVNGQVYVIQNPATPASTIGVATAAGVVPAVVAQALPPPAAFLSTAAIPNMTATQPVFYQPPAVLSTPLVTPPPAIYQQPYMYPGMQPYPVVQGHPHLTMPGAYPPFTQPAFGSMGFTGGENMLNQMAFAQNQDLNKKQDMKPADDDPLRMYWVREPDNTWTQRNRITIDSGDIGDVRWYAMDGQFYAVRQSAG